MECLPWIEDLTETLRPEESSLVDAFVLTMTPPGSAWTAALRSIGKHKSTSDENNLRAHFDLTVCRGPYSNPICEGAGRFLIVDPGKKTFSRFLDDVSDDKGRKSNLAHGLLPG